MTPISTHNFSAISEGTGSHCSKRSHSRISQRAAGKEERKDCQKQRRICEARDRQKSDILVPRLFSGCWLANKRKPPLSQLIFHGSGTRQIAEGLSGDAVEARGSRGEKRAKGGKSEGEEDSEGFPGSSHGWYSQLYPCSRLFWDISCCGPCHLRNRATFHVDVSQLDSHRSLTRNRLGRVPNRFAHIAASRATSETPKAGPCHTPRKPY